MSGYLAIVLHSHLPYVRHPEYADFLEEDWLYEAITETYLPLLDVFNKLVRDGVGFHITISLTPTLLEMLGDGLLMGRYRAHLSKLIDLSEKEMVRTRHDPSIHPLSKMYHDRFLHYMDIFENGCRGSIINGFKDLMDQGGVEIVTCAATHAYLPLLVDRTWQDIQLHIGIDSHVRHLRKRPEGVWLPENAYTEGIDGILAKYGIEYTFLDAHGLLNASVRPAYGVYAPISSRARVSFFGRDLQSAKQVWSAREGYPGDYDYREFYRDIGYDLDLEYVRPYLHSDGSQSNLGIKYYRITGQTDRKQPYVPQRAHDKVMGHAGNFVFNRAKHIEYLCGIMDREPILVSAYDAELFGHWWFEGPEFIEQVFRRLDGTNGIVRPATPAMYLREYPVSQIAVPSQSSWGDKGYHEVWLNGTNDWTYRHVHIAQDRMKELMRTAAASREQQRGINQALRELLLAQSSDWPFIMNSGTMVEYARKRFVSHIARFTRLYEQIKDGPMDLGYLEEVESKDNIFPWIDYRNYTDTDP